MANKELWRLVWDCFDDMNPGNKLLEWDVQFDTLVRCCNKFFNDPPLDWDDIRNMFNEWFSLAHEPDWETQQEWLEEEITKRMAELSHSAAPSLPVMINTLVDDMDTWDYKELLDWAKAQRRMTLWHSDFSALKDEFSQYMRDQG